jgi:hypothetical protein
MGVEQVDAEGDDRRGRDQTHGQSDARGNAAVVP